MDLTPMRLAAIYCACPDTALVGLLAELEIEELFIAAELQKRIADKRIGTVLVLAPFFGGSAPTEKWLTKKLKVDRIKSYRPREEEEAAKLAGITDKTFRNYITYLKKIFASKK
jgi:hypothetical protein